MRCALGHSGACDRLYFVCPDYRGGPAPDTDVKLHLWVGQQLDEMAIKAGLYDWLIARSA